MANLFKCFKCLAVFDDTNLIITHLKYIHLLRDNVDELKCVVKGNNCVEIFYTYRKLKQHIKSCENANQSIDDDVLLESFGALALEKNDEVSIFDVLYRLTLI